MGGKGLIALAWALAACGGVATKPAPMGFQPGHIDLARGPDGNTEILDAPEGLIVVDTGRHPDHARAIIDHARAVGKPVIAIVNTHWHLDHTTGNRDILAAFPGAKVIASRAVDGALADFLARSRTQAVEALASGKLTPAERARAERLLAAVEDRAALVPSMPVVGDGARMLGGRRIEFHLARNAATEGDVWMVVPDEKLAIVGDLVVAPVPFFDTGCEDGLDRRARGDRRGELGSPGARPRSGHEPRGLLPLAQRLPRFPRLRPLEPTRGRLCRALEQGCREFLHFRGSSQRKCDGAILRRAGSAGAGQETHGLLSPGWLSVHPSVRFTAVVVYACKRKRGPFACPTRPSLPSASPKPSTR